LRSLFDAGRALSTLKVYVGRPPGHVNREMVLTALSTSMPPGAHVDVRTLCPVRSLNKYMERNQVIRHSDQLFVCFVDTEKASLKVDCRHYPASCSFANRCYSSGIALPIISF
jgi:hypothetical protein